MARMVSSCSTPSSRTLRCWFILTCRGTSSSFVHPPRGCSKRTGFLKPRSSTRYLLVSWLKTGYSRASQIRSDGSSHLTIKREREKKIVTKQTWIKSAWPLCIGFLSWKAKTASAPISLDFLRISLGVSLYLSRPSFHLILSKTSNSPPTSQSPDSWIILTWGCPRSFVPNSLLHLFTIFSFKANLLPLNWSRRIC